VIREVEAYGDGRLQRGEWWRPDGRPRATIVLVHGGFWRPSYDRSLEDAVAADLCERGYLCWNIDYAASDAPWPTTLVDAATAYDHATARVGTSRVVVVGHSAGGHLALWLSSRHRLPAGSPGAPGPSNRPPDLCVAQGAVAALADAAREGVGAGAVEALLGGTPAQVPDRYAVADPVALLPTGVPTALIHGTEDADVPVSQSTTYAAAAQAAGDRSTTHIYDGGHYEHLDPASRALDVLRQVVADTVSAAGS
jgi:acetyl esterase/lipase